jgi:DNA ligase (NAD+)
MNEADNLERIKKYLDNLYEQGEPCIHPDTGVVVSDPDYDLLVQRLAKLRPDSVELKKPSSATFDTDARKVKHYPPMTSISKAIGPLDERKQTLQEWLDECDSELGYDAARRSRNYVQAPKMDGCALALYYKDGNLIRAGLRPRDGVYGEDVTENVKHVEGIPTVLPIKVSCCIRGEIICLLSVFDGINKAQAAAGDKLYANPRNYATGSVRQFKDPTITKERKLTFRAYSVYGLANPPYKNEMERAKWVAVTLGIPHVNVRPLGSIRKGKGWEVIDTYDALETLEKVAQDLDYETDGVIISVSELEDQEQLGTHGNSPSGNPKGKIAWKFSEEKAVAKVASFELGVGRTGHVTPVLHFENAVQLAGTQVSKATGHNYGYVNENQITVGTVVEIIKSGEIIPKVHAVLSGRGQYKWPTDCPACGHRLVVRKSDDPTKAALFCTNDYCGEKAVAALCHYLTTFGVKGLSDSTVGKLYANKLVREPADFYRLQVNDLIVADGEDPRNTKKEFRSQFLTVARIHMISSPDQIKDKKALSDAIEKAAKHRHQVPLWQFFAALGIPTAGKSAGRELENHFRSLDGIRKASVDELKGVAEVGEKTAQIVHDWFRTNATVVDNLLRYVEPTLPKVGKLTGKTFVFTGGFPEGKEHWQKAVEDLGAKCGSSVSKKTDYCVVGTDAGSKKDKAEELGITQLTLDELKKML